MTFIRQRPYIYLFLILNFFILKNSFALESLSYSGRLVQTNGAPVSGPVNLRAELVYTNALSTVLCSDDISGVVLSKGVFHVKLDFACTGGKTLAQVLAQAPTNESVAIQITDVTNSKTYSFQALHSLPYASVASQLVQMGAGDGEFLKWDDTAKKWKPGTVGGASGGTVTSVSATGPLSVATPTSTPAITITQANGSTSGYLSAADWNTFNNKEGTLAGGTTAQYYRGDKSWQTLDTSTVPENVNLYFTNARVLGVPLTGFVTATGAIVATDSTLAAFGKAQGQINAINTASSNYLIKNSTDSVTGVVNVGTTGLLQLVYVPVGLNDATNKAYVDSEVGNKVSKAGDTVTGVLTLDNDLRIKGGSNFVTIKGHATSANYNLTLPQTAGTAGYVLSTDGTGATTWSSPAVGSSNITDGSITDADVNASAGIAQSKIANLTTDLSGKEPTITAGTTAQYWKGNKTWASLQTDVQALILSGFATGSNSTLVNTDTVSGAFGKVQGQIDAINTLIAGKEASLTAGTTAQFYRGDKSWQTLNGGAVVNTPAGAIAATTTQNAINELDSEKQDKLTATSVVDNRELRFYELPGNGSFYSSLKSPDDLAGNIAYTLPLTAPTAGQILSSNASGVMSWISIPSAPVTTVFGRSGVVAAANGDYTASQITNVPAGSIAATDVQSALNELDAEKQSNITAGTTAQYYRGDKTWATLATDAINSVLSTFSLNAGSKPAVTNTDTVVGAFGKVQKTLNDINSDYVSKSANQTINGSLAINSLTGFITVPTPINPTDAANKAYVDGFGQWVQGAGANAGDVYRSTGNVGIGTATPGQKLTVAGMIESTSSGFKFPDGTIQSTSAGGGTSYIGSISYTPAASCQWGTTATTWANYSANASCSSPTLSGSALAPSGGKVPAVRFANVAPGRYLVYASVLGWSNAASGGCNFRISDGTNASANTNVFGSTGDRFSTMIGEFSYGSTQSFVEFSIQGAVWGGSPTCLLLNASSGVNYAPLTISLYKMDTAPVGVDNLGNHVATQNLVLGSNWLSGDGANSGIKILNGNVGIGTANPLFNFDVQSTVSSIGFTRSIAGAQGPDIYLQKDRGAAIGSPAIINANDGLGHLNFRGYDGANYIRGARITGLATAVPGAGTITADMIFYTNDNAADASERMRIKSNGFIGIGTSSPSNVLHISGNGAGAGNQTGVQVGDVGTGAGPLYLVHNNPNIAGNAYFNTSWKYAGGTGKPSTIDLANGINFITSNATVGAAGAVVSDFTPKMNIQPNGNVGIGMVADDRFTVTNGTTTGRYTTGGWTHSSDARLKHDTFTLDDSLEKILQLRGVEYKFNKDSENKKQIGFIAQEVESVFPEVVLTDKKGYKSMIYSNLIAPLVEAVKELHNKFQGHDKLLATQSRQIASIKADNEKLKSENDLKTKEIQNIKRENAAIKSYLCRKDPQAPICR